MSLVFIGLGSNLGDGRLNLAKAWQKLGQDVAITTLALSSPYSSRPLMKKDWQKEGRCLGEQWFTNAAGVLETGLSPLGLLGIMQDVEKQLGRDRQKSVDRVVDLDILYFDDFIYVDEQLVLPHPEIASRRFVLAPLEELAPDRLHPGTGKSVRQMMRALPDLGRCDIIRLEWSEMINIKGIGKE